MFQTPLDWPVGDVADPAAARDWAIYAEAGPAAGVHQRRADSHLCRAGGLGRGQAVKQNFTGTASVVDSDPHGSTSRRFNTAENGPKTKILNLKI